MPASSPSVGDMHPLDPHPVTGEPVRLTGAARQRLARRPRRRVDPGGDDPRGGAAAGGRRRRDVPELQARVSVCRACPRLVRWREDVARSGRRASFADQPYWGRPGPSFGDPDAEVLLVGLAPAANGTNRTGRMFTGDSSGDVLYAALHRTGFAALPTSVAAGDGQALTGIRIVAAVRCAPPGQQAHPGGARHLLGVARARPRAGRARGCGPSSASARSAGTPRWPPPVGSAGTCRGPGRGSATPPR